MTVAMRKLKLQSQISIDGFIADINGKTDWLTCNWSDLSNWDAGLIKYSNDIMAEVDCILLSRKMAEEGFITFWSKVAEDSCNPLFAFAKKITRTYKIVFTRKLTKSLWNNTDIANGNLTEQINKLKNLKGGDMIVYGGAAFVSSLIKAGLIDEFHLCIHPAVLGKGMPIFNELGSIENFTMAKSTALDCGIVIICYEKK